MNAMKTPDEADHAYRRRYDAELSLAAAEAVLTGAPCLLFIGNKPETPDEYEAELVTTCAFQGLSDPQQAGLIDEVMSLLRKFYPKTTCDNDATPSVASTLIRTLKPEVTRLGAALEQVAYANPSLQTLVRDCGLVFSTLVNLADYLEKRTPSEDSPADVDANADDNDRVIH